MPGQASVYENEKGAFIIKSHLKVMLEEDYLAIEANLKNPEIGTNELMEEDVKIVNGVSSAIVKEVVIPEIEKEVNQGRNFAKLRQIFNSMILAAWYKIKLRDSLLGQVYVDQAKVKGIDTEEKQKKLAIYEQYMDAFRVGVFDMIRADYDEYEHKEIPRKYFAGGVSANGRNWTLGSLVTAGLLTAGAAGMADMDADVQAAQAPAGEHQTVTWVGVENADASLSTETAVVERAVDPTFVTEQLKVNNIESAIDAIQSETSPEAQQDIVRHITAYVTDPAAVEQALIQIERLRDQDARFAGVSDYVLNDFFVPMLESGELTNLEILAALANHPQSEIAAQALETRERQLQTASHQDESQEVPWNVVIIAAIAGILTAGILIRDDLTNKLPDDNDDFPLDDWYSILVTTGILGMLATSSNPELQQAHERLVAAAEASGIDIANLPESTLNPQEQLEVAQSVTQSLLDAANPQVARATPDFAAMSLEFAAGLADPVLQQVLGPNYINGGTMGRWRFARAIYNPGTGQITLIDARRIDKNGETSDEIEEEFKIDGKNAPRSIVLLTREMTAAEAAQTQSILAELGIIQNPRVLVRDESAIKHRIFGIAAAGEFSIRDDILNEGTRDQIKEALDHEHRELSGEDHVAIRAAQFKGGLTSLIKRLSAKDKGFILTAQGALVPASPAAGETRDVGGINLNARLLDLQIERDQNGNPLPIPQQPMQTMHIDGFVPVIINIMPTPAVIPAFSELQNGTDDQDNQLGYTDPAPGIKVEKFRLG